MLRAMTKPSNKELKQSAFLQAYSLSGVIGTACQAVSVSRSTVRKWREDDEQFEERFQDAFENAIDPVEEELRKRAMLGFEKPVIYQGVPMWRRDPLTGEVLLDDNFEPIPLTEPVQNNDLLKLYIAANRGKYNPKTTLEHQGPGGTSLLPRTIDVQFVKADGNGGILKEGEEPEPDPYATENDCIVT